MMSSVLRANQLAVSEIIGAMLLLIIAAVAGAIIYSNFLPVPLPDAEPNVHLIGYVLLDGQAVIEHIGGEPLYGYEIHLNGEMIYLSEQDVWDIGETTPTDLLPKLTSSDETIDVTVFAITKSGDKPIVFDGTISGKTRVFAPEPPLYSMPISTLRTNSEDEDLICYRYFVQPNIPNPTTYIYSWMLNRGGTGFKPFANLIMPFDTQDSTDTRDYSTNNFHGVLSNAQWTANGKVGGAYYYTGSSYIRIPYCFFDDYLDAFTIETWVKTTEQSGTILTFDREHYFELAVSKGMIKWTTSAYDGVKELLGSSLINDNIWHHIAVTYDNATGAAEIYIDGLLEKTDETHTNGASLGDGGTPSGYIGKGSGAATRQTIFTSSFETQEELTSWDEHNKSETGETEIWETLRYDTFNSGWGSYYDGGGDCFRTSSYTHEGSYAACIRDNSGTASSFILTNGIDVDTPSYNSLKIDFWWMWNGNGWNTGEDWWLRYYDGTTWNTVLDMTYPSGHTKDTWYHEIIYINETDYTFPTNMKILFQCDASYDSDLVYIDQIYINCSAENRLAFDFNLLDSDEITPHTGSYSIGGHGDFDPEYAAFNRTGIDISIYSEVTLSLWYSYKDTEDTDFMGLYYKYNNNWAPIFEIEEPQIGSGQIPWAYVEASLPEDLETLYLQFKWMTSQTTEYVAIDDLLVTGIPPGGEDNFTGYIDELHIYPRVLSPEQIYQNYYTTMYGDYNFSVIVAEETDIWDLWKCLVTPNNTDIDDIATESDTLLITPYEPGTGGG